MSSKRLIILSEHYYPEDISTGYFLTGLAEGLSGKNIEVIVICSEPKYREKKLKFESIELHNGVKIRRINTPFENKNNILKRIGNIIIQTWRINRELKKIISSKDKIMVVTNPPTLPWIVSLQKTVHKNERYLLIHDVYPDVLVPTGLMSEKNIIFRLINKIQKKTIRSFGTIIVLGRDMKNLIEKKIGDSDSKISIIENWGDPKSINMLPREGNTLREKFSLQEKFIIQFSGNLGRTHGINDFISLAKFFSDDERFHFLVFGDGSGKKMIEKSISDGSLNNVTLLPSCKREELEMYLNACDLFFLALKKGMEGISVPSRLYNVMAAGNPILAVASHNSELGIVVREEKIGWVVNEGELLSMINVLNEAFSNSNELYQMRIRARNALETKYCKHHAIKKYLNLFNYGTVENCDDFEKI